jgi:hypothetical protein
MKTFRLYAGLLVFAAVLVGCAKVQYQKTGTDYYHITCNRKMSACEQKAVELCNTTDYEAILADSFDQKRMIIMNDKKFYTAKKNHEMKVLCRPRKLKKAKEIIKKQEGVIK